MKLTSVFGCIIIVLPLSLQAVTIVYNMRIAMVTRQHLGLFEDRQIAAGTLFRQWREAHNGAKQTTIGGLGTYIHSTKNYYLMANGALGHVNNRFQSLDISRTQTDDLLFSGGYGHRVNEKLRFAYLGLFGIPTHRDFILELAQFGTGHVGLGAQLDGAYDYFGNHSNIVFAAARLIHFFPRSIEVKDCRLQPLYALQKYNLKLGNIADIYISHQTNWKMRNRFEFGYDATFGFGASITPEIPNFGGTARIIRHNFFGAYYRLVPFNQTPTGLILGLSYGFDSKPKLIGNKHLVTLWGVWAVIF